MIEVYYTKKGTAYVLASDLRDELEIKTPLSIWFPRMIEYGFIEDEDYYRYNKFVNSAGSIKKEVLDWAVRMDMAKHIAMMQRTARGKEIREYLLHLDQKVTEGELVNQVQLLALFDICKVMGLFSVQKFFEQEHYNNVFKSKDHGWWEERASLFGYTANDLKVAMEEVGKKYVNQRQALMSLDKYELIRMGVMDMFLAMGKTKAYAKNISNFAKEIAKQLKSDIYNDIGMSIDFKTLEQKLIITDLKSYKEKSQILGQFLKLQNNPKLAEMPKGEFHKNLQSILKVPPQKDK